MLRRVAFYEFRLTMSNFHYTLAAIGLFFAYYCLRSRMRVSERIAFTISYMVLIVGTLTLVVVVREGSIMSANVANTVGEALFGAYSYALLHLVVSSFRVRKMYQRRIRRQKSQVGGRMV